VRDSLPIFRCPLIRVKFTGSTALGLTVVLGDGADWIWRSAARFLAVGTAEIVEIVDIYHAWEHREPSLTLSLAWGAQRLLGASR
jgi:hypothetical protein